jgi:quercetin dioxygenase-like cupin family protein
MKRGRFLLTAIMSMLLPFHYRAAGAVGLRAKKGFRVSAGESRSGKHLKMKGVTFNVLDLKISSEDTEGALAVFEQTGFTPMGGPPLHIHPYQDEFFYVLEGEYRFRSGDDINHLGPGDLIFLPRNIPHAFIQLTENARVIVSYLPAGKMEGFFETTDSWTSPPDEETVRKTFADHDMIVVGPPLH